MTHDYEAPSTYVVTLTVVDGVGRRQSSSQTITVTPGAQPTADFVFSPVNSRVGQNVNFNAAGSRPPAGGTIVTYTWDFGDGSPLRETSSPVTSKSFAAANVYNVTLFVTDSAGRTSIPKTTAVAITP